jgi:hypothetical protein
MKAETEIKMLGQMFDAGAVIARERIASIADDASVSEEIDVIEGTTSALELIARHVVALPTSDAECLAIRAKAQAWLIDVGGCA